MPLPLLAVWTAGLALAVAEPTREPATATPPAAPAPPASSPDNRTPAPSPTGADATTPTIELSEAEVGELTRLLAEDAAVAAHGHEHPPGSQPPAAGGAPTSNPDMAIILDAALAAFSADEPRQGGGHDPAKNGFTLQQLELAFGKAVDPYFRFDAAVVLTSFGLEIEEAFATTMALPASLQLRAGMFLTRFGRHNPTHPHAWEFVDQPFVFSNAFGGEANRGMGVELSWLLPLPWYVELLGSATDAAGAGTARSFWGADDLGVKRPQDLQLTGAVRQFFPVTDDWSILWGVSGAFGPNPSGHRNRSEIYGSDLYVKYRPIRIASPTTIALQVETLARRRQIPGNVLRDSGGYAHLLYRFAQRWSVAARGEWGSAVSGTEAGRFEDYLPSLWQGSRHRETAAVTFYPTEFSRLRLQGSRDADESGRPPIWGAMLALEVLAGAHGAHSF